MSKVSIDELFPCTTDRLMNNCTWPDPSIIKWLLCPARDEYGKLLPPPQLTPKRDF